MHLVKVRNFLVGKGQPLAVMAGPCVIESEELCMNVARELKRIFKGLPVNLIFKASYDKANRSAGDSFRGPGIEEGLRILEKVREEFDLPIISDVHTPEEAERAGAVLDVLQIPAFLCRQTDLILAAAKYGKAVSVKKGQFLAPWDMQNVIDKIHSEDNENIILTDRGTTFGYNNLVSDMRGIPIMQSLGYPVCFDATHSVQLPGGKGTTTGGQREFISILAKAAIAAGANCIFLETHPNPDRAKSDASSQMPLTDVPELFEQLLKIYEVVNG